MIHLRIYDYDHIRFEKSEDFIIRVQTACDPVHPGDHILPNENHSYSRFSDIAEVYWILLMFT